MTDAEKQDRPPTLVELLQQASTALIEFMNSQSDVVGYERVEDAAQLVYDALAMVDPGYADDVAKTR